MAFFKSFRGPTRDEIWTALREQIGGEVIPAGFCQGQTLQVRSGEWTFTLDEYTTMIMAGKVMIPMSHTRMRAPFPNPSGFRFSIYRASIFSSLGTMLGMQDINVGHSEFDADFVLKGNNESALRALFGGERLRALITAQPKLHLGIEDDNGWFGTKYPPSVDVLVFDIVEPIRDVERLKGLYDIFAETLSQLTEIGVAGKSAGSVAI